MKNDENVIRCADCPMMRTTTRERMVYANIGQKPKGDCFCDHPNAKQLFEEFSPKSSRVPGFIAFTKPNSDEPKIKTTPRWCPRKLMGNDRAMKPKEISKVEAYTIIGTAKPRGLFYLQEGNGYTGIDNMTGDAWVEEFPTMLDCLNWLTDRSK